MDRWMDGWTDGRSEVLKVVKHFVMLFIDFTLSSETAEKYHDEKQVCSWVSFFTLQDT